MVNECYRIVRTRAPLNVKNWQEAYSIAGDSMFKEIQDKFQIVQSSRSLKMYAFVIDTMQRLYRNSKNRLSNKRVIHINGNLTITKVKDILTKENDNVKPSVDVVWLSEHTRKNEEVELEWADATPSKIIHDKLRHIVAEVGDTMTQEEILIQVLEPRSGYIRGKGTALCGYVRRKQQLEQGNFLKNKKGKYKSKK
ncbi:Enolase [Bienertia sinuspersici]